MNWRIWGCRGQIWPWWRAPRNWGRWEGCILSLMVWRRRQEGCVDVKRPIGSSIDASIQFWDQLFVFNLLLFGLSAEDLPEHLFTNMIVKALVLKYPLRRYYRADKMWYLLQLMESAKLFIAATLDWPKIQAQQAFILYHIFVYPFGLGTPLSKALPHSGVQRQRLHTKNNHPH